MDSPFIAPRHREGLKPGQWDPAQNPYAQAEVARRGLLENMHYCLGPVPEGGAKVNTMYDAAAMGTRLAYWIGLHFAMPECIVAVCHMR